MIDDTDSSSISSTSDESRQSKLIPFGKTERAEVVLLPDGSEVEISTQSLEFARSTSALKTGFWNKTVIDVEGKEMCTETAVAKLLRDRGWEAVWVSRGKFFRGPGISPSCELSTEAEAELLKVRGCRNYVGCWDVFAFKSGEVLFVECKAKGEALTPSQRDWLAAALAAGFTLENFLVVRCRLRAT